MTPFDRKAATAAYKERKVPAGIYAIRCRASDEVWIGSSRHLDTQQNGLWFALRLGTARNGPMQTAWTTHGEDAFAFEELERLPEDDYPASALASLLRSRLKAWLEKTSARPA